MVIGIRIRGVLIGLLFAAVVILGTMQSSSQDEISELHNRVSKLEAK